MDLNKIEVFKIAQNIEQDGIDFYKKASQFSQDVIDASIFMDLAEMEAQHYNIFLKLEQKHKDEDYIDSELIKKYLKDQVSSNIFQASTAIDHWAHIDSPRDIFLLAHKNEKDTVEFYTMLKESVTDRETKKILDQVITEEKSHVEMMQSFLKELS